MQPEPAYPRSFGKYTLLRPLAAGGMAEVYLAQMRGPAGFDKACVVKRVLPSHMANKQYMEMFLDEARVIARLSHPNVVQVFDMGRVGDEYFMAMEYVPGADLQSLLDSQPAERRRLPIPVACRIIAQVAEGLDHAHRATDGEERPLGIVHRDVSPSNVIVSTDGVAKICDFGIAKFDAQSTKTEIGSLKGKIHYMSPEQIRGEKLDGRSDLFSLGALLYEATVGVRPFEGSNPADIAIKILNDEVVPPDLIVDRYPRELWAVVQKMMAKKPAQRFSSAREVQVALDELLMSWAVRATSNEVAAFLEQAMPGIGERSRRAVFVTPVPADRRGGDRRGNTAAGVSGVEATAMSPFGGSVDLAFGNDSIGTNPQLELGSPLDTDIDQPPRRDERGSKAPYAIALIVLAVGAGFYYLTRTGDQPQAVVTPPAPAPTAPVGPPTPVVTKPEPPKTEVATVETKPAPAKVEPVKEPAKIEPAKVEPEKAEPEKAEPVKTEPEKPTVAREPKHHKAKSEAKSEGEPEGEHELPKLPTPPPADDDSQ